MQDLTFGEQVKIILSRKDMTIKELAKKIEGRTGKKMSRQNLTQRLGRDNFQERDMRMIAEILGCPFYLNILDDSIPAEKTEDEADTIQRTENVPAAGREPAENGEAAQPREQADTPADGPAADKPAADEPAVSGTKADTGAGNVSDEPEGDAADQNESGGMANERDITIGELVDIHKKLDVLESAVKGSGLDEGGAVPDAQQSGEHPGDQPAETPAEEPLQREEALPDFSLENVVSGTVSTVLNDQERIRREAERRRQREQRRRQQDPRIDRHSLHRYPRDPVCELPRNLPKRPAGSFIPVFFVLFFPGSDCFPKSLAHPAHVLYKLYSNILKTALLKIRDRG